MSFPVSRNPRVLGQHKPHDARRLPRFTIAIVLLLSTLLPGLAIAHVTAQVDAAANVPMFRGNPARTGELPGPGPDPNDAIVELWSFEARIISSPAVADGVVYAAGGYDGNLYAIDATTGQLEWSAEVQPGKGSPTVVDGVVYVGSYNGLYALDAVTGQQNWFWKYDFGSVESSPAVVDGVVYVGSQLGLAALDAATGKQLWIHDPFGLSIGEAGSSPAVVDGIIYVAQKSMQLYALDAATGEPRWQFEAGDWSNEYPTAPAVADGMVYIVNNYDDQLYAIDVASGQKTWAVDVRGRQDGGRSSFESAPAISGGVVYAAGGTDSLYALDAATGEQRWVFPAEPTMDFSPPVVVDGIVYAGSSDGLYAIDAVGGQQLWSYSNGDAIDSAPAVSNGVIFVAIGSRLFALSNPTPAMQTATAQAQATATEQAHLNETATAEAQATATAQAHMNETVTAVAGITATAQAHLDATTTAVAGQTTTAAAQAMATSEAIQLAWQNYFWTDVYDAFSTAVAEFPGMSVDRNSNIRIADSYVPGGYSQIAYYPVPIEGGPASAMVLLAIFPSKDDADAAMENITGGLIRSGWETQDVKGLEHNHVCLTVEYSSMSEALCYVTRDDALIISYSAITLPKPEAVLLNAVDLAKTMDNAYDEVDRPD